jgi:hypothetical protein
VTNTVPREHTTTLSRHPHPEQCRSALVLRERTSIHRPVKASCFARSGRTILHVTHSCSQLPAHNAGQSRFSVPHSGVKPAPCFWLPDLAPAAPRMGMKLCVNTHCSRQRRGRRCRQPFNRNSMALGLDIPCTCYSHLMVCTVDGMDAAYAAHARSASSPSHGWQMFVRSSKPFRSGALGHGHHL